MAKIAVTSETVRASRANGEADAPLVRHLLARGDGWRVYDIVCTSGPRDRAFEEQHVDVSIAIVTSGSFQYRSSAGRELMTPGSLLLGNPGQLFRCGHEHGVGDRCISFQYAPGYFEEFATGARAGRAPSNASGIRRGDAYFPSLRVPPLRELSGLIARATAGLAARYEAIPVRTTNSTAERQRSQRRDFRDEAYSRIAHAEWEELSVELAVKALCLARDGKHEPAWATPAAEARVTRVVRAIEQQPDARHDLVCLAGEAKLSRYHFLRLFQQLTGLTPHQYVIRTRLRRAAMRLMRDPDRVTDIALDCGFGDVSNFNHAFRAEFGISPRLYRQAWDSNRDGLCTTSNLFCFRRLILPANQPSPRKSKLSNGSPTT